MGTFLLGNNGTMTYDLNNYSQFYQINPGENLRLYYFK
jgi:hypothetical protein